MMKKLTSLLLSVVLLVSLLACGASAKTNSTVRVAGLEPAGHGGKRHRFPEV